MKKIFTLAVLALGATMMMACNPDNNEGGAPVNPDYTLSSTEVVEGYLDHYGDMYQVGLSDFNLEVYGLVMDEAAGTATIKGLFMEFMGELSNTTGVGTYTAKEIDWNTGEGLTANTYLKAADFDGQIAGCGYIEMDGLTEELLAYEGIASGTLTVSKSGEVYSIKGLFTTLSGKTLKVDCTSEAIEYSDLSQNGGIAPLSVKNNTVKINKYFSSAAQFLKK